MNLTDPQYNFPPMAGLPKKIFMIACTQRTGSTFLALEMWRTGKLGAPMSYFNPWTMDSYNKAFNFGLDYNYIRFILSTRTSPNGIFGYKIAAEHWVGLRSHIPYLFNQVQPNAAILLRRKNKVAQAISLFKAELTGQYFPTVKPDISPDAYNRKRICALKRQIERSEALWAEIFANDGLEPIEVWYEDLPAIASQVIEALGFALSVPNTEDALQPMRSNPRRLAAGDLLQARARASPRDLPSLQERLGGSDGPRSYDRPFGNLPAGAGL